MVVQAVAPNTDMSVYALAFKTAINSLSEFLESGREKLTPAEVVSFVNDVRVDTKTNDFRQLPEVFVRIRQVALDCEGNGSLSSFGIRNLLQSVEHAMLR